MGIKKINEEAGLYIVNGACLLGPGHAGINFKVTQNDDGITINGVTECSEELMAMFSREVVFRRAQAMLDETGEALINGVPFIGSKPTHPLIREQIKSAEPKEDNVRPFKRRVL